MMLKNDKKSIKLHRNYVIEKKKNRRKWKIKCIANKTGDYLMLLVSFYTPL